MTAVVVCSVGASDPWNAAGLGLDIRALAACGARAVTVVAGVTAQDAGGVRAAAPVAPELIAAQFASLAGAGIRAYRVGALLDVASVVAVAEHLRGTPLPVIYDPVLAPSGGGRFAQPAVVAAIVELLLPSVTLVTPNLAEAAELTRSGAPPADAGAMEAAARKLVRAGARAALVKGGHLASAAIDVLVDETGVVAFEDVRLVGEMRGTGCLLADALAAALARGETVRDSVTAARAFVRERFASADSVGGMRVAY